MDMRIEVFYSVRCGKCRLMESVTHTALEELGMDVEVNKLLNPQDAMARGVMSQPALWINDHLKVQGRVPLVSEIKQMIEEERLLETSGAEK
ncbi:MAG: thioredoxin family protein [Methanomassiliicoccus sp.]|nr:thioredoxin family protein [Methanomassiliicoccus sp.]